MSYEFTDFIVIDDDPVNNRICNIIVERMYAGKHIKAFTDPEEGLAYIEEKYKGDGNNAILLLDINMPILSGWDVLERFERLPEDVRKKFTIYILSSSVDIYDKQKAESSKLVSGYIEKPLTMVRVKEFFPA